MTKYILSMMACVTAFLLSTPLSQAAPIDDPFGYFNVYSLNDIGTTTTAYGSDFQGKTGAAGDVYFSGFNAAALEPADYGTHVGGSATLGNGTYNGHVEAGGNITLKTGATIKGNVYAKGDVTNYPLDSASGSVSGDVFAEGTASFGPHYTVSGTQNSGMPYNAVADHNVFSNYFKDFSKHVSSMFEQGGTLSDDGYGHLSIAALTGVNVFEIDADMLSDVGSNNGSPSSENIHTFNISGASDSIIYINVLGEAASVGWLGMSYSGGITAADVLFNFVDATSLTLTNGNYANFLAANAQTDHAHGTHSGNLIVGDLQGGHQINVGDRFRHGTPVISTVPEPGTVLMLSTGILVLMRNSAGRKQK